MSGESDKRKSPMLEELAKISELPLVDRKRLCQKCHERFAVDLRHLLLSRVRDDYIGHLGYSPELFYESTLSEISSSVKEGCAMCNSTARAICNPAPAIQAAETWNTVGVQAVREFEEQLARDGDVKIFFKGRFSRFSAWHDIYRINLELSTSFDIKGFSSIAWDVAALPDDPASEFISTRPINPDVDSEEAYETAKAWLKACIKDHPHCVARGVHGGPSRLLDLSTSQNGKITVINRADDDTPLYAALSYCWGGEQAVKLTSGNLEQMTDGTSLDDLPQTIVDAIIVTKKLDIKYLWIDALCIIQDSDEDKSRELGRMSSIFRGACVTIQAGNASKVQDGFLKDNSRHEVSEKSFFVPLSLPNGEKGSALLTESQEQQVNPLSNEPIERRAWTMQERLLSPRRLVYNSRSMRWECQAITLGYGGVQETAEQRRLRSLIPNWLIIPSNPGRPVKLIERYMKAYKGWINCIKQYSEKLLSVSEDKLRAFSGIASCYSGVMGQKYVGGIWADGKSLIAGLLWVNENMIPRQFERDHDPDRPGKSIRHERFSAWRAPSWSWACVDGVIGYKAVDWGPFITAKKGKPDSIRVGWELESQAAPFAGLKSASIYIKQLMKPAVLAPKSSAKTQWGRGYSLLALQDEHDHAESPFSKGDVIGYWVPDTLSELEIIPDTDDGGDPDTPSKVWLLRLTHREFSKFDSILGAKGKVLTHTMLDALQKRIGDVSFTSEKLLDRMQEGSVGGPAGLVVSETSNGWVRMGYFELGGHASCKAGGGYFLNNSEHREIKLV